MSKSEQRSEYSTHGLCWKTWHDRSIVSKQAYLVVVGCLSNAITGSQKNRIRLINHFGRNDSGTVKEFELLPFRLSWLCTSTARCATRRNVIVGSNTNPLQASCDTGSVGSPSTFPSQDSIDQCRLIKWEKESCHERGVAEIEAEHIFQHVTGPTRNITVWMLSINASETTHLSNIGIPDDPNSQCAFLESASFSPFLYVRSCLEDGSMQCMDTLALLGIDKQNLFDWGNYRVAVLVSVIASRRPFLWFLCWSCCKSTSLILVLFGLIQHLGKIHKSFHICAMCTELVIRSLPRSNCLLLPGSQRKRTWRSFAVGDCKWLSGWVSHSWSGTTTSRQKVLTKLETFFALDTNC